MKLKRFISIVLISVLSMSSIGNLSIVASASELSSYTWDLTNCGTASGYVTPEDGTAQNNCTTLIAGGLPSLPLVTKM